MTARDGAEPWFVARMSPTTPGRRRGIVPVTRAGYLTLAAFMIGETLAALIGIAIILTMPDMMVFGVAIIVIGVALSLAFLLITIRRHTDYALTIDDYNARQARNG